MTKSKRDNGANLGFEQKLWQAADKRSRFIVGAYVSCPESKKAFEALGIDIPVSINSHLFFQ